MLQPDQARPDERHGETDPGGSGEPAQLNRPGLGVCGWVRGQPRLQAVRNVQTTGFHAVNVRKTRLCGIGGLVQ